ncbi:hypothetical protein HYPSUDRAFT_55201 [Hypholoma sublateritium FD-334 SS-4]|uniref:Uncharacterized protein n=1 Tax=Hypholoma sublateritium (strain FD-334 SS-4) TaxID=945553 RepID=A0A0D2L4T7_HYPSF|nr:hypothetical protein HYPSUDRAFT_55201 [Hypholoma sublateritium FD-334 SS-4]
MYSKRIQVQVSLSLPARSRRSLAESDKTNDKSSRIAITDDKGRRFKEGIEKLIQRGRQLKMRLRTRSSLTRTSLQHCTTLLMTDGAPYALPDDEPGFFGVFEDGLNDADVD